MRDEHIQKSKQILIVEDHPESVELLRIILEDEGYSVQSVVTGRHAIRTVAPESADESPEFHPDLILLDLRLPDMNGVDVVRELQENLSEVPPVVFLSADAPHRLNEAAHSVGATAVRKPFNFDELFQAIKRALASTSLLWVNSSLGLSKRTTRSSGASLSADGKVSRPHRLSFSILHLSFVIACPARFQRWQMTRFQPTERV